MSSSALEEEERQKEQRKGGEKFENVHKKQAGK
jgi:hypothetical protein